MSWQVGAGWLLGSLLLNLLAFAWAMSERFARASWERVALDACEGERLAQAEVVRDQRSRMRRLAFGPLVRLVPLALAFLVGCAGVEAPPSLDAGSLDAGSLDVGSLDARVVVRPQILCDKGYQRIIFDPSDERVFCIPEIGSDITAEVDPCGDGVALDYLSGGVIECTGYDAGVR